MNYIPITLDKPRSILMGFGAMQAFKKIHGKSIMKLDWEKEDPEDLLPLILYVGLKHEDKELTLEKTTELIDIHLGFKGMMDLMPKIMEELGAGEEEEQPKNAVKAAVKKK